MVLVTIETANAGDGGFRLNIKPAMFQSHRILRHTHDKHATALRLLDIFVKT